MALLSLKVLKWVSLMLLGAGHLGGWLSRDFSERQRAVYWLATPGFFGVWLAGYGMARLQGISMGSPWVSAGLVLSIAALQALVFGVEKESRPHRLWGGIAFVLLLVTVAAMTVRPGGTKAAPVPGLEAHP